MKCTAKITSKGQITIPIKVRRALGVGEDDSVIFEADGEGIRALPKRKGEVLLRVPGDRESGNAQRERGDSALPS